MPPVIINLITILFVLIIALIYVNHSIKKETHLKKYQNDKTYQKLTQDITQTKYKLEAEKNKLKQYLKKDA